MNSTYKFVSHNEDNNSIHTGNLLNVAELKSQENNTYGPLVDFKISKNTLETYEIAAIQQISGEGYFSVVKKGVLRRQKEYIDVAIKVLKGPAGDTRAMAYHIFKACFKSRQLQHPNLVRIISVDIDRLTIYYQYLDGINLKELRKTPLTQQECRKISLEIARAITYLHRNKLAHGDLKLDNIMILKDGTAVVIDLDLMTPFADSDLRTFQHNDDTDIDKQPPSKFKDIKKYVGAILVPLWGELEIPEKLNELILKTQQAKKLEECPVMSEFVFACLHPEVVKISKQKLPSSPLDLDELQIWKFQCLPWGKEFEEDIKTMGKFLLEAETKPEVKEAIVTVLAGWSSPSSLLAFSREIGFSKAVHTESLVYAFAVIEHAVLYRRKEVLPAFFQKIVRLGNHHQKVDFLKTFENPIIQEFMSPLANSYFQHELKRKEEFIFYEFVFGIHKDEMFAAAMYKGTDNTLSPLLELEFELRTISRALSNLAMPLLKDHHGEVTLKLFSKYLNSFFAKIGKLEPKWDNVTEVTFCLMVFLVIESGSPILWHEVTESLVKLLDSTSVSPAGIAAILQYIAFLLPEAKSVDYTRKIILSTVKTSGLVLSSAFNGLEKMMSKVHGKEKEEMGNRIVTLLNEFWKEKNAEEFSEVVLVAYNHLVAHLKLF